MLAVNAGARLDRLPASRFHYRILGLIGGGMFLDAFEIYLQGAVLAALIGIGWSTPAQNANFLSATFAGMVIGAWLAGITGDRYGRRFSYQANLLIFGLASLAGAAAPSMEWLIAARFIMGIGLGAEIVVGYVTISELTPPASRGRWGAGLATITNSALVFCSTGRPSDHSFLRLALDVCDRGGRRAHCLVSAQADAGVLPAGWKPTDGPKKPSGS